ncbi:hypothetical protein GCM10010505_15660 [Kitasatospora aburaviensis]
MFHGRGAVYGLGGRTGNGGAGADGFDHRCEGEGSPVPGRATLYSDWDRKYSRQNTTGRPGSEFRPGAADSAVGRLSSRRPPPE